MPRKNKELTPEERIEAGKDLSRRMKYYSEHPEELARKQEANRQLKMRQAAMHVAQHQPQVTDIDINPDGNYVTVEYTRQDGVRVSATYSLLYGPTPLDTVVATHESYAKELRAYRHQRLKDAAAAAPPPDSGKTPRS